MHTVHSFFFNLMLGKGLEVNADNTKYVVVSSEQNAG